MLIILRLKNLSFQDELKFTLDFPKPLLLADVAIRVMQLPFDLLSPLSPSYSCKRLVNPCVCNKNITLMSEDDGNQLIH